MVYLEADIGHKVVYLWETDIVWPEHFVGSRGPAHRGTDPWRVLLLSGTSVQHHFTTLAIIRIATFKMYSRAGTPGKWVFDQGGTTAFWVCWYPIRVLHHFTGLAGGNTVSFQTVLATALATFPPGPVPVALGGVDFCYVSIKALYWIGVVGDLGPVPGATTYYLSICRGSTPVRSIGF